MQWDIVGLVAIIFASAIYLILKCRLTQIILGFGLLSNGINLFLLSTSQNPSERLPPIIEMNTDLYVDPTPQALILTAIVIGFGMLAYLVILSFRIFISRDKEDTLEIFKENT